MVKRRFSSHPISDEITMRRYRVLTSVECTTIMIAKLTVTSGLRSFLIRWFGWECDGIGLVFVEALSLLCALCAFVIILCDILKFNLIG
jgi:hypothetical protein